MRDAELTDQLRSGDHAAFTEIYERYYGILYAHALKFLRDEAEVSDLLAELFIKVWTKRDELSFAPPGLLF